MFRLLIRTALLAPVLLVAFGVCAEAKSRFVYAVNEAEGSTRVYGYSVSSKGRFTQVPGSPFAVGGASAPSGYVGITRLVVVGDYLYYGNAGRGTIDAFGIDLATGTLTPVPGSPFALPDGPQASGISLAATGDGLYLFASGINSGAVTGYAVSRTGRLDALPASRFVTGATTHNIRTTPDGRFLFVSVPSGYQTGQLVALAIGPCGALTPIADSPIMTTPATEHIFPTGFAFSRRTRNVFVSLLASAATIDGFDIGVDGRITRSPGAPFQPQVGSVSDSPLLTRDESFLYVASAGSQGITAMAIGNDRTTLSLVAGSPFTAGEDVLAPTALAIDSQDRLLYALDFSERKLRAFAIAPDGSLTVSASPAAIVGNGGFTFSLAAYPSPPWVMHKPEITLVDDATGDTFVENIDSQSLQGGEWSYRVAATGETFTGAVHMLQLDPDGSILSRDTDSSAENPSSKMRMSYDATSGSGTVKITVRGGGRFSLRDSDIRDNGPCE
jgi:6-phosphogluconolactonase (cycloisomerase 2 family)